MADKVISMTNNESNITPSVDHNEWLNRLETQLIEPTNKNSIKSPQSC